MDVRPNIGLADLFLHGSEGAFLAELRDLASHEAIAIRYEPGSVSYGVCARCEDPPAVAAVEPERLFGVLERFVRDSSEGSLLIQFDREHPSLPLRGEPSGRGLAARLARRLESGGWAEPVYELVERAYAIH